MKVNSINTINFGSKTPKAPVKRYVSKDTQQTAQKLLQMMTKETKYVENDQHTGWTSNLLVSLKLDDNIKFTDNRYYVHLPKNETEVPKIFTFQSGNNILHVNADSGEVIGYKKSFFKTWSSLLEQAEMNLHEMLASYSNEEVVKKGFLKIAGFTRKGFELLEKAKNRI